MKLQDKKDMPRGKGFFLSRGATTALIILSVMVLNVVLSLVTESFGLYLYRAEYTEDYTVTGMTEEILSSAEGKTIDIIFCMTEEELENHTTGKFVLKTAKQYGEKYDFINLTFVNTFTRLDQNNKRVDLEKYKTDMNGNETGISRTSVVFASGENYRVLTNVYNSTGFVDFFTFDSQGYIASYNGETVLASMISWVLSDEHRTAYITKNHGEMSDATFGTLLAAAGYSVKSINLQDEDVPEDASLVVISNPKNDFERAAAGSGVRTEIERLTSYVNRGGSLYVTLDPYVNRLPNLESFIKDFGISFAESEVGGVTLRNIVRDTRNAITTDGYTILADYAQSELATAISSNVKEYSDGGIILREASALTLGEVKSGYTGSPTPLLVSTSASVCEVGGEVVDDSGRYCIGATSTITGEYGNTARIFVMPSVYITASDALISNSYANRDCLYSLFEEFYGADNMPYGCNSVTYVSDDLKNLTMGEARAYTAVLLAMPVILAVTGTAVIIRRKNR